MRGRRRRPPRAADGAVVRHGRARPPGSGGLLDLLRDALGGAQAGFNLGISADGYVTGRRPQPPGDGAAAAVRRTTPQFSRALDARLREIGRDRCRGAPPSRRDTADEEPLPPLRVEFAGGHRIAVETEAVVKRESDPEHGRIAGADPAAALHRVPKRVAGRRRIAAVGAVAGHRARRDSGSPAPAAVGRRDRRGGDAVRPRRRRRRAALRRASSWRSPSNADDRRAGGDRRDRPRSMLLGMWTTAATFYGLMFVDFPSLQQLGALHRPQHDGLRHPHAGAGAGAPAPPPAAARVARAADAAARRAGSRGGAAWVLAASVVLTCVLGVAADAHPHQSDARPAPIGDRRRAARSEDRLGVRPAERRLHRARRGTGARAAARDQRAARRSASSTELPGLAVSAADAAAAVGGRAGAARRRGSAHAQVSPATRRAALEQARVAGGFTPGSFDPFAARLPHLLDPAGASQLRGLRRRTASAT